MNILLLILIFIFIASLLSHDEGALPLVSGACGIIVLIYDIHIVF